MTPPPPLRSLPAAVHALAPSRLRAPARALALAWLLGLGTPGAQAQPAFQDVRAAFASSETIVTDRHGEPIHRLRTDRHARRGEWVPLARMSAALRQALVLSEDKRFYEHSGVDWRAVSAAAWANLWNTRTRGASTLTMQLTGLLDEDLRPGAGRRTLAQKFGQALAAERLERRWQKDEILEAYLNLVPFRGELVGIDALARTLFGKAPHGLNEAEAALAAALLRAPNAPRARAAERACGVLRLMRPGADCLALDMLAQAALARRAWAPSEGIAPHLARRVAASAASAASAAPDGTPRPPPVLPTTLDAATQRVALHSLRQQLHELRGRQVEDGAALVLDNASGEVLAWVGSSGHGLSRAAEVDGVTAPRQPGSTLKPFLYAQAIAERRLTAASLLEDSPAQLPTASGLYIPQNYDRRFKGWVSVRTALAASLNIPAVRALVMVSPEAFHRQLGRLGMPLPEGSGYYGYSLALGSAEVTLLQLANAYRALANGGRLCPVRWQPAAARPGHAGNAENTGCTAALDAGAAFIVGDILADRHARALTFGTDSVLATRFWSAVKTGTSKDMRDNWAVGYSRRYTVAVWVGNASGQPMHGVSGTSGAAPVWAALMRHLHAATPSRPPAPPPGLARQAVRFGGDLEAARDEWFLPGTAQALFAIDSGADQAVNTARSAKNTPNTQGTPQTAHSRPGAARTAAGTPAVPAVRIRAPAHGSILALDPDIPPRHQRLRLSAQASGTAPAALRWRIGGREVGRGPQAAWLPWPGRHTVQLLDAQGRVLDEVRIDVRGAGVKPGATRP